MRETEERPDVTSALRREVGDLRACMRDLVAFGAMPATWTGREPPAIVESLVDALLSMLHAELVFARLDCPPHGKGVNVVCAAAGALPAERARGVAEALEPLLTGTSVGDSLTTPNPLGPGTLSVAVAPLGYQGEFGFLLAGSGRPGFPDDIQRALLGVGANQVALAVKERQLSERRRHELALRESDERFRTTFAHASVGMAMATPQGRFLQVNRAYCEMTGYTEEELLATDFQSITHPDDLPEAHRLHERMLAGEVPGVVVEKRFVRKDGEVVWAQNSVAVVRDTDGNLRHFVAVVQDVTDRKRAERALRETERQFRAVFDASLDAMMLVSDERRILDANPAALAFFGLSREELSARKPADLSAPGQDADGAWQAFRAAGRMERTWRFLRADGAAREAEFRAVANFVPGRHLAVFRDVTERKRAEAALREAEDQYRSLFENAVVGIFKTTPDGRLIAANQALAGMFGYDSPQELMASITDVAHELYVDPERRAEFRRLLEEQGSVSAFEAEVFRKDHGRIWISVSARAVCDEMGAVRCYEGVDIDITDRKRAEAALRDSEQHYRLLFEANPLPMWVMDAETYAFLAVNEAAVRHYGYGRDEFRRMTALQIRPPQDVGRFVEYAGRASAGLQRDGLWRHVKKDGTPIEVEVASHSLSFDGRPAWLVVSNDVTQRRRAEESLRARARQQAAVADLGQRALEGLDLETLMSEAAAVVSGTLDVALCGVLERLPDGRQLALRAGAGWKDGLIGSATVSAGRDSQAGFTLLGEEPVIVEDFATETRFSSSRLLANHRIVSGVSVVIPGPEQPFGVLGAHTRHRRVFTTDDVHFLRSIANVLAAAIIRKREEHVRRQLLERVMSAQEDERRRIARELHDETGQALASLLVGLRAVEDARSSATARRQAERLRELVAQTMDGVGRLARGLHPSVLEDLGLGPALARHAAEHGELLGIAVSVETDHLGAGRLPAVVETSLYRIAQEAIANVGKHAHAARARVILHRENGTVALTVEDDGCGFPVERTLRAAAASGHLGLHDIRERAAFLDGTVSIESRPGEGTTVSVRIPLHEAPKAARRAAGRKRDA